MPFPLEIRWFSFSSVDSMHSLVSYYGNRVLICINLSLHVAKELVGASQLCTRHIFYRVRPLTSSSWDDKHEAPI